MTTIASNVNQLKCDVVYDVGEKIICGSEIGNVYIWNTVTEQKRTSTYSPRSRDDSNPRNKTGKQHNYDRNKSFEWFEAIATKNHDTPIITDAKFIHSTQVKNALQASGLFPSLKETKQMDQVNHDFGSAMIVTCDFDGTLRLFLRKKCMDAVHFAAGPQGDH